MSGNQYLLIYLWCYFCTGEVLSFGNSYFPFKHSLAFKNQIREDSGIWTQNRFANNIRYANDNRFLRRHDDGRPRDKGNDIKFEWRSGDFKLQTSNWKPEENGKMFSSSAELYETTRKQLVCFLLGCIMWLLMYANLWSDDCDVMDLWIDYQVVVCKSSGSW